MLFTFSAVVIDTFRCLTIHFTNFRRGTNVCTARLFIWCCLFTCWITENKENSNKTNKYNRKSSYDPQSLELNVHGSDSITQTSVLLQPISLQLRPYSEKRFIYEKNDIQGGPCLSTRNLEIVFSWNKSCFEEKKTWFSK